MKQRIRLTESDLHRIVKESVKRMLNEIDYSQIPMGDYTERNKWWKSQIDNDFPNHGLTNNRDWQSAYNTLVQDKEKQQREQRKAEREQRKAERGHGFSQREMEDRSDYIKERKQAKMLIKRYNNGKFTVDDFYLADSVAAELMNSTYDKNLYKELSRILDELEKDEDFKWKLNNREIEDELDNGFDIMDIFNK